MRNISNKYIWLNFSDSSGEPRNLSETASEHETGGQI